jgi:PAS domain S-box-containing protein
LIENTTDAVFCYEYDPPIATDLPVKEQVELLYDGTLVECNDVCARTYGFSKASEVIGKKLTDVFGTTPGSLDPLFTGFVADDYRSVDVEGVEQLPDGSRRHFVNNGHGVIEDGKLVRIWGTYREVTDRKRAEEQLRTLSAVIEQSISPVAIVSPTGMVEYVNPKLLEVYGATKEQVEGKPWRDFASPHSTLREHAEEIGARVLGNGEAWQGEVSDLDKDGERLWREATVFPIKDEAGEVAHTVYMSLDITDRKLAEQEKKELEEQLVQAQKMEAIGRLAGGVAHDFNNLLTAILGFADLIRRNASPGHETYEAADLVTTAARRAAKLTSRLLGFARKGKHQHVPVDMNAVVDSTIVLLDRTVDKQIEVTARLFADPSSVMGDPSQLEQVVLNLAVNARDAMPEGGTLVVETCNAKVEDRRRFLGAELVPGDYVVLSVRDTGEGIPADVQEHVFEPFFTTKARGEGTGMGLAMVYGIVRNHGGALELQSEVGGGTEVSVYLPMVAAQPKVQSVPEKEPLAGGSGTILVVDDEPTVCRAVHSMLAPLGYQVVTKTEGRDAIEYFKANPVDLVILDMAMPMMDGPACFHRIRTIDPSARIIIATGHSMTRAAQELLDLGASDFVQKPFVQAGLARTVATALAVREPPDPTEG